MRYPKLISFIVLVIASIQSNNAQLQPIDSLKRVLVGKIHDTTRVKTYIELSNICPEDEIYSWSKHALVLSNKLISNSNKRIQWLAKKAMGDANNNIGFFYQNKGETLEALVFYEKGMKIREDIHDAKGIAESSVNLGFLFEQKGSIASALEAYNKALTMYEKMGAKSGMAVAFNNIGYINQTQGDLEQALLLYSKSLAIREQINDQFGIAQSLTNIGAINKNKHKYDEAIECHKKALVIQEKIDDKIGAANNLNNLGYIYQLQDFLGMALICFNKSLAIRMEIGDRRGETTTLCNLGNLLLKQKQTNKALEVGKQALKIALELGYPGKIRDAALLMKNSFRQLNDFKNAFEMDELFIAMHDSLNNEETRKASARQHLKYEYDKKAAADSVKNAEEKKVVEAVVVSQRLQIKQDRIIRFAIIGGLALVIIFAMVIFNRFKASQRQKKVIEEKKIEVEQQKTIVEEKQKEIVDSIHYALRIQQSLLPTDSYIEKNMKRLKIN